MSRVCLITAVLVTAILCAPVLAEVNKPAFGGDFTFRRIKPPVAGARKLITIQVPPKSISAVLPAIPAKPVTPAPPQAVGSEWFWNEISPKITAAGPGRFLRAVEHMSKAPSDARVGAPRLSTLQAIAQDHGRQILTQTLGTGISPALVLALIAVESGGRRKAQSEKGAHGLMQLIPATAQRFGVIDRSDPGQNIKGGVAYLDWLLREFDGDPILALAGYNAGEGAVRSHAGVPPYAETRAYVPKVLAAWQVARGLCMTVPVLAGDGCVFRTVR